MENVTQPLDDKIFDAVERFQRRGSMIALVSEVDRLKKLQTRDENIIIG